MVNTLLFDLDNTLLDFNQAERIAISKTLKHFNIDPKEAVLKRYSELNQIYLHLYNTAALPG